MFNYFTIGKTSLLHKTHTSKGSLVLKRCLHDSYTYYFQSHWIAQENVYYESRFFFKYFMGKPIITTNRNILLIISLKLLSLHMGNSSFLSCPSNVELQVYKKLKTCMKKVICKHKIWMGNIGFHRWNETKYKTCIWKKKYWKQKCQNKGKYWSFISEHSYHSFQSDIEKKT